METFAVQAAARPGRLSRVIQPPVLSTWVLSGALVLYLGFSGGGYAFSTYGQAGIAVWWLVVVASAWSLLPATPLSRSAICAVVAFGAFTAWTALGTTWSISSGRSLQDLALVTSYFGILVLGVAIHRDRNQAVRHSVGATATAITILCTVSVATRLWPGFIPSARTFDDAGSRLSWPLDYWNALAALSVLGIPLLLSIATSGRRLLSQAAAAGAIPVVVLCGALTQSRGGLIAAGAALIVWLALVPERVPKLASGAFAAAGSAALVAAAFGDRAVKLGHTGAGEHHQAATLLSAIILVCLGVGIAQAGIGRLIRHTTPPQAITPPRRVAAGVLAVGVLVLLTVALVIGVPHKLSHLWTDFKNPVNENPSAAHLFQTSGEGRYQYWVAGINSAKGHELIGSGPGTFQQDWLPRAHIYSYVTNAHSLYVETYTELGFIGLGLLTLFIVGVLTACVRAVIRSQADNRTLAAGITAAVIAFFVGAAFDWLWQVPALVAIVMLLLASVLAPEVRRIAGRPAVAGSRRRFSSRRIAGVLASLSGLAALVAIAYPLSVNTAITDSQSAVDAGNLTVAVKDARQAVSLESGSGEAQIQLALVLEARHEFGAALAAANHAVADERDNWTNWLTLSRIQAENGEAQAAVRSYEHSRSLNPESSLFST